MTLASGQAAQLGFAIETTAGTPVTPSQFVPLVDESIVATLGRLDSPAIIAGRRALDSDMWNGGNHDFAGDLGLELYTRGVTSLFRSMFGAVNTTGAGPYTHTFTPGDLSDDYLTVQVGRPSLDGTVNPFTYAGTSVTSWELACTAGEIATLGLSVVAMEEQAGSRSVSDGVTTNTDATVTSATAAFTDADVGKRVTGTGIPANATVASVTNATTIELSAVATATDTGVDITIGTALATASLPTGLKPFKFNHGSVTAGGSALNVKAATIAGDNALNTDRRFIGSQAIAAALEAGQRAYTGTLDIEFNSLTEYERYVRGDELAIELAFTSGTDSATITMNARYDGGTPNVTGPDILEQSVPFMCVGDTDAEAITAVLVNSDSAA